MLAFLTVYVVWGSTYWAIRIAVETVPPLLSAAARMAVAGGLLFAWAHSRGAPLPSRRHWISGAIVGSLLALGNGGVHWAEQTVPSGTASLMVATIPLWLVLLDTRRPAASRFTPQTLLGLGLGLAGVGVLVGPSAPSVGVDWRGALVLLGGALCWARGSLLTRQLPLPASFPQSIALQLLSGSAVLLLLGVGLGEPADLMAARPSTESLVALAYLTVFGTLLGFSAYGWLLRHATPAQTGSYAFVNPLIATLLALAVGDQAFAPALALGAILILAASVLLVLRGRPLPTAAPRPRPDGPNPVEDA